MTKSLAVILSIVILDAMGIGLVMPILPAMLRALLHSDDLGWRFGAFLSLYALLQLLCAPILGSLSDRFGRRPVLLISMAGAVIDYIFMTLAPSFWWLFLGRAIAGVTAANGSMAAAYLTDIVPEDRRARAFGYLSACFGLGFIIGPALGGVLGAYWLRAPFVAAALLNALNLLVTLFVLPESHTARTGKLDRQAFHPFAPMRWAASFPALLPLLAMFIILALVGEVGGTVWVLYGQDKFAWDSIMVGLSLAGFGLFHALAQALVAGPVSERWGEQRAVIIGIVADTIAYFAIAFTTRGWFAFLLFPLFCIGGIGAPALQSLLSKQVDDADQGRLQGVLTSMSSLVSIVGPLIISEGYFASRGFFPGLVWVAGAMLYLLCLPILFRRTPGMKVDAATNA
ncbi:Tet(A)/Tet(B)/Tet(C) family tetracycline efflux MFS transporter [Sphingomonas sp. ERG5]|uniref:Tet(A)/Tet(B)/Tet(C) family tetracycline efflux MFS transporter n=1 Tax=Sphingomonas sp. ERG5 TaxID=1381597 RepID=UPI00054C7ADE|nr:Tet(A)/Tet(B)/Tet(C) family tetracycline efflux MFS transporter [Sphingomonas sp. ERG5]